MCPGVLLSPLLCSRPSGMLADGHRDRQTGLPCPPPCPTPECTRIPAAGSGD